MMSRRNLRRSLYWRSETRHRSGADSPRGIDYGQSGGAHVQFWRSDRRVRSAAPARPARFAKATLIWAAARKPHSVPLRFTARGLRRAFDEPPEKGTGFVS